jgi:predicted DNA-binding transcriptional regulator AlpA
MTKAKGAATDLPFKFHRIDAVEEITTMGRSQIFEHVEKGAFPKPIRVMAGGTTLAWLEEDLWQWLRARLAAVDSPSPEDLAAMERMKARSAKARAAAKKRAGAK